MPTLDEYSATALPLTLLCKGANIGSATGFFYKVKDNLYLVSCWHVFSGRNTYTGQAKRPDAALPDAIGLSLHSTRKVGEFWDGLTLRLEDADGKHLWLQHTRGQDVDVAVLPIHGELPEHTLAYELPRPSEAADMAFSVGREAFIIGFPKGITHQKYLPIWKRASIATEPDFPHDNLPVFLVDAASREGMSGAPVVLRSFGDYATSSGGHSYGSGIHTRFIGIYSGRYGADDPLGAQLGRTWHRSVIDEIVEAGVPHSYELRSVPSKGE